MRRKTRWQFKYNKYAFHFHLQTHLSAIYLCMYFGPLQDKKVQDITGFAGIWVS